MRLRRLVLFAAAAAAAVVCWPAERDSFTVVEATIPQMRAAMEQKRITSRGLVDV